MKRNVLSIPALLLAALLIIVAGCKKNEDTITFALSGIKAGSVDMNGATPPTNVSTTPTIVATFSTDVKASSVDSNTITLERNYDNTMIDLNLTVSGKTITIEPMETLANGALFKLTLSGIKSTDDQNLPLTERSFTTEGTFAPAGQYAFWNFNGDANDQVGNFSPMADGVIDVSFVESFKAAMGQAAQFNGNTSLIRIPNGDMLDDTHDFTLAFWIYADSNQHGQFSMGLAGWYGFQFEIAGDYNSCKLAAQYEFADGTTNSEDLWFNGEPLDQNSWQGWTYSKDLTNSGGVKALLANKWAFIVCQYNSATKVGTMYINGEKMKEQDFNLWPETDPKSTTVGLKYNGSEGNNTFVFGFIQDFDNPTIGDSWADYNNPDNNHFKGMLDNVRIFHKVITEQEIMLTYNSEKPQ